MPEEIWKPVVGWERFYEVSSHGRIRSLPRYWPNPLTGGESRLGGNLLRSKSSERYVSVVLNPGSKNRLIHRLVCEAFHGPPPEGKPYVLHFDDDGQNNRADNLRWGNAEDNTKDQFRNSGPNHNALKTHCPKGHKYIEENTYILVKPSTSSRVCRECLREHDRKRGKERLTDPDDPRHGTVGGYMRNGCRCRECKLAAEETRQRRVNRKRELRAQRRAERSRHQN